MPKIILQVGHLNIEKITSEGLRSWRDVNYLKRSTGASGERNYHSTLIAPKLKEKLVAKGFEVVIVDAIYSKETSSKADLWVSMHYDGGGDENRCMISSPLRNANPVYLNAKAHDSADKFCEVWKSIYPNVTGTINRDNRITAGMLEYYAFDYTDMNTPSVIIEHFNNTSAKGAELKQKFESVVNGDYLAILKYFGMDEGNNSQTFTLDTDIPSEVETKYKLKRYESYNNKWTFGDLIDNWCAKDKLLNDYDKKVDELMVKQAKEVEALNKQITTLNRQIVEKNTQIETLKEENKKLLLGKEYTVEQLVLLIWNKVKGVKVQTK